MLQTVDKIIGLENTKLYNGKRYFNTYKATENNHNFYKTPNSIKGNVVYNDAKFYNVNLKYDLFLDQLIFEPIGERRFINIELIRDKVSSFKLNNNNFINSKFIKANNNTTTGYLEIIQTSPSLVLYAKRKKFVSSKIKNNSVLYLFSEKSLFYLSYNNEFKEIQNTKSFRKLFVDYDDELKEIIKENKSRFKKDREGFYKFLAQWIVFKQNTNSTN